MFIIDLVGFLPWQVVVQLPGLAHLQIYPRGRGYITRELLECLLGDLLGPESVALQRLHTRQLLMQHV